MRDGVSACKSRAAIASPAFWMGCKSTSPALMEGRIEVKCSVTRSTAGYSLDATNTSTDALPGRVGSNTTGPINLEWSGATIWSCDTTAGESVPKRSVA